MRDELDRAGRAKDGERGESFGHITLRFRSRWGNDVLVSRVEAESHVWVVDGGARVTSMIFGSDPGALMVFKNARGKPKFYSRVMFFYDFVAYDPGGDAFVDGSDYGFKLAELAYGSRKLVLVTPHGLRIRIPGGVQYDGSSLAVE
jgi:hypothetical protein